MTDVSGHRSETTIDPETALIQGAAILAPVLTPHGFTFVKGASGTGSGGAFASGEFLRNDRRLELHFRFALGLVTYHVGTASLDHETYLRYRGKWQQRRYPNFSSDPLESFRALAHDLKSFCEDFLSGDGDEFRAYAAEHARHPHRFRGFGALGKQ